MVNERSLRADLSRIAGGVAVSDALPMRALTRGRRLRRRRALTGSGTAVAVAAAFAWLGVSGATPPPAVAAVACYADHVVVAHRTVTVGRSGVHLDVTNATPDVVRLVAGDEAAFVPPGRTSVDVALRPGPVSVRCESGSPVVPVASITVKDRHHVYVDDALDCARPQVKAFHGSGDIVSGDPVRLTADRADRRAAVAESAGYPGASARRLVRLREGTHIVGLAVWHAMVEPGTWTLDELRVCAS